MYLIEFGNGEIRQSKEAPSDIDLEKVKRGELSIFHYGEDSFETLTNDGEWAPVEAAQVVNKEYLPN